MSVLFVAIPVALVIAAIAIVTFVVQVRSGQYDDLETPAHRILFDDEIKNRKARDDQTAGRRAAR